MNNFRQKTLHSISTNRFSLLNFKSEDERISIQHCEHVHVWVNLKKTQVTKITPKPTFSSIFFTQINCASTVARIFNAKFVMFIDSSYIVWNGNELYNGNSCSIIYGHVFSRIKCTLVIFNESIPKFWKKAQFIITNTSWTGKFSSNRRFILIFMSRLRLMASMNRWLPHFSDQQSFRGSVLDPRIPRAS